MCLFQGKPAGAYCSCCQECSLYLNACMPIVIGGYIVGECELDFCYYCPCYEECEDLWGKAVLDHEVSKL